MEKDNDERHQAVEFDGEDRAISQEAAEIFET